MANNLSDSGEALLLDWLLTTNSATRPTSWYLGVGTSNDDAGLTGEPSGNGYARQAVTFSRSGDTVSNVGAITFGPNTTSDWGTMASVGIFTASTGGSPVIVGALTAAKAIAVGDSLTIGAGAQTFTLS